MLQTQTVSAECLELLKQISADELFSDFVLVGGTALALQLGHRKSIDLDFFGDKIIQEKLFIEHLNKYGKVQILKATENILITAIDGIKVDFVNYSFPLIAEKVIIESLSLASPQDIAAMKLNAIAGRGSKKDFVDLYFLLDRFSLREMIGFYRAKYAQYSEFSMLKSLTYFNDAEKEEAPFIFHDFDWHQCKNRIRIEFAQLNL